MRAFLATIVLLVGGSPLAAGSHVSDLDEEVPWGCARRDCIPAIDDPTFGEGAWLDDADRVLGVELGGDARAYPVRILNWHEIVNDEMAGTPIVVTYCPLCGTGLTFERTISHGTTSFGVSGRLYKNDLVMYDRATGTLWSQALGEAIWGPLHAERLAFVPTATTSWGEWKRAHPDTRVLERPSTYPTWRYDQYPYGDYESEDGTLFPVGSESDALHPKEWVLGVFTDNESVAYRQEDVARERIIRDTLDGRPLDVLWVDGAPQAIWRDAPTPPRQVLGFWFAWHDFHPDTRLWGRLLAEIVLPREPGGATRIVFSEGVLPDALAPHLPPHVEAQWEGPRVLALRGATPFTIPAGTYGANGTALLDPLHVPLGATPGEAGRSVRDVPAAAPALVIVVSAIAALLVASRRSR